MTRLFHARYEDRYDGYVRWRDYIDGEDRYVYVHRLLAVAEYGFDAVSDQHVHHINGYRWDNRTNRDSVHPEHFTGTR